MGQNTMRNIFLNDFSNYRVCENCPLLGYYEVRSKNSLLTFVTTYQTHLQRYQHSLCNNPNSIALTAFMVEA